MSDTSVIFWFRRDLRLGDNTALKAARDSGERVIPLFIFDPALLKGERLGVPRLKFLLKGLEQLSTELHKHQRELLIRHGDPVRVLADLVRETGASALYFNRDYSPYALKRDQAVRDVLEIDVRMYDDAMLHPPETVCKKDGDPYVVYTPYKKLWLEMPKPAVAEYEFTAAHLHDLSGIDNRPIPTLDDLGFGETIEVPEAGESVALERLSRFMDEPVYDYRTARNQLMINPFEGDHRTSGLSPYFRLGMLSPRKAFAAAMTAKSKAGAKERASSVDVWISELAWREFYMQILFHYPRVYNTSFRPEYENVDFQRDDDALTAWQEGRTGYPIVDAAMRQMHTIGWMHNRARMIVASFLTKDLLIYWREGDVFFMRHLIDGDPAANNGGWQWAAGTGTDAQPYFRIFNPVSQSQQYDPNGEYIRHYVPELRDVPDEYIHEPWKMDSPPEDYPAPIIDHKLARERTIDAFKAVKG